MVKRWERCVSRLADRQDGGMDIMGNDADKDFEVGIVGLGLIGGSLAKAIKAASRHVRVVAFDRDDASLARAVAASRGG